MSLQGNVKVFSTDRPWRVFLPTLFVIAQTREIFDQWRRSRGNPTETYVVFVAANTKLGIQRGYKIDPDYVIILEDFLFEPEVCAAFLQVGINLAKYDETPIDAAR